MYDIKPGIEEAIAQSQPQYMGYYQSQPTTPQDASSYSNPPSIPKIQVKVPNIYRLLVNVPKIHVKVRKIVYR